MMHGLTRQWWPFRCLRIVSLNSPIARNPFLRTILWWSRFSNEVSGHHRSILANAEAAAVGD